MSNLIDRQAAIDGKICIQRSNGVEIYDDYVVPVEYLEQLPPAQPERIIHCKDCEWWTKQEGSSQGRCALYGMYPSGGWFCGNARMREVTE